jgi:hypothetical protein
MEDDTSRMSYYGALASILRQSQAWRSVFTVLTLSDTNTVSMTVLLWACVHPFEAQVTQTAVLRLCWWM